MGFRPLREYAIIGNDDRTALIDQTGSIDWLCLPHGAASSVFARLLDTRQGGHFAIRPTDTATVDRAYRSRTNVLETTFETESGTCTLTDYMPVGKTVDEREQQAVYRRLDVTAGAIAIELEWFPAFEYAYADCAIEETATGYTATREVGDEPPWETHHDEPLTLEDAGESDFGQSLTAVDGGVVGTATLEAGETHWFRTRYGAGESVTADDGQRTLDSTVAYWQQWTDELLADARPLVDGTPWRETIVRSALVLKLLINEGSGAIYAAPTTSLPEAYGTDRNWDYRYNWIRDAKFTVQALYNLGRITEASDYFEWFRSICHESPEEMQPVYGVHGERDLAEYELEHLSGHRYSSPVRIGNGAAVQHQHDVYGAIIQAMYETLRHDGQLSTDDWDAVCTIVDYVCDCWEDPDYGIWEYRDRQRHYLHSKLLCWVALDRAIDLATDEDVDAPLQRWRDEREAIKTAILEEGYSEERGSFVQHFETDDALDAACLLIPIYEFLPPDDERVQSTLETVLAELATEDGFVYRTKDSDAVDDVHGTFVFCTCWLIDALVLAGRLERAEEIFLTLLEHTSPLGLLAERIDPATGELVGNYPQAFSHIGLINSAIYLASARADAGPLEHDPQDGRLERAPLFRS